MLSVNFSVNIINGTYLWFERSACIKPLNNKEMFQVVVLREKKEFEHFYVEPAGS